MYIWQMILMNLLKIFAGDCESSAEEFHQQNISIQKKLQIIYT